MWLLLLICSHCYSWMLHYNIATGALKTKLKATKIVLHWPLPHFHMRNLWETMTRRWIPIISLETVSHQIRLCQENWSRTLSLLLLSFFCCTSLISGHPVLCKNIRSRQNNPKFFFKIVSNQSRYLLIKHWQSDKLIQQLKISLLQMQRLVGDKMDACSHVLRVYWGT